MQTAQQILLLDLLLAACFRDLMTDRIPNGLVLTGIFCGLSSGWLRGGWQELSDSLLGALLPIALLWFFFRIRAVGAGDVKLLAVSGSFLGGRGSLLCLLASFLCGGLIAAALFMFRGNRGSRIRYFLTYLSICLKKKKICPYPRDKDNCFHFSIPILWGAVMVMGGVFHR